MKFRIDPRLYDLATPAREREWRMALTDLNRDADGEEPTITVSRREDGLVELVLTGRGPREQRVLLTREMMRSHFRDYRQVIQRLARSDDMIEMRALETLDYAKKVVHDEAGEVLTRVLSPMVKLPHALARRLFTLVFLVSTELPESLVRRHRHRL